MNLSVKLGGLRLSTPIVCASGTFGFGNELTGLADYNNIGAVVAKTITLHGREGNRPPRIYETPRGVINAVGLQNPGLKDFLSEGLRSFKKIPSKRIVSIGGFSDKEYLACVKALNGKKGIDAFEINLSCPNLRMKKLLSQNARATFKLTAALKKLTSKPLIVKITPEVNDITIIAKAVEDAGADALSLVNTYFAMAINIYTRKPFIGNVYGGYSGPAIKPMSLFRVYKAAGAVKMPVIGGGGIETAEDAIEFLIAGASAISLGTINLVEPNAAKAVLSGIVKYMRRQKTADIRKITGSLNA
jgi:dihydroorotate dehydrogenase (NAD+) catalytic subunit